MTDFSLQVQGYGHLGQPKYDENDKLWSFSRVVGAPVAFSLLHQPICLLEGTEPEDDTSYVTADRLAKNTAIVANTYPELKNLTNLALPDLIASWAISNSHQDYDASVGDLVAFGHVSYIGREHDLVPIYATVTGPSGSVLRLSVMEKHLVQDQRSGYEFVEHTAPISTQSTAFWGEDESPIQQIVFSHPRSVENERWAARKGQRLAVRLPSKTVVFTVLIDRYGVYDEGGEHLAYDPWKRISIEPILEIPINLDPNSEHADFCFNPWFYREVAVIDRTGKWAIYQFQDKPSEALAAKFNPRPFFQGHVKDFNTTRLSEETPPASGHCRQDGWARIAWTTDTTLVAVCTRTQLQFLHMRARSITALMTSLPGEQVWHLAMCTAGEMDEHIFLLTSTRVMWIKVQLYENIERTAWVVQPEVHQSARHFRDPMDFSMRIRSIPVENGKHQLYRQTC
jgi:RNA polymerase I-specific transcription initiation factor RRN6